jgi:hypothetical protein
MFLLDRLISASCRSLAAMIGFATWAAGLGPRSGNPPSCMQFPQE